MPELPEVETIRQDLSRLIVGKKIVDIATDTPKMVRPSLAAVKKAVVGKKIIAVERRGKLLILELGDGSPKNTSDGGRLNPPNGGGSHDSSEVEIKRVSLLVHLKLTGRLLVRKPDDPADDWVRAVIGLSEEEELRFCDLRKFGWIRLIGDIRLIGEIGEMGIEPFDKGFTVKYLKEVFGKTARAIKIVLMDQAKIAGIGNIYANEALFLAGIDPRTSAQKLNEEKIKRLKGAVLAVLKAGIKYRGASDQYYLDALGHKGRYQDHFLVYGRAGQLCLRCRKEIKRISLGGRGTFYCPACQR